MRSLIWILIAAFAVAALGCGGGEEGGGGEKKKDPTASDMANPDK